MEDEHILLIDGTRIPIPPGTHPYEVDYFRKK